MRTAAPIVLASLALPTLAADVPPSDPPLARAFDDAALQWSPCPPFIPAGCQIAVLHGDPSQPNADIFFKVPGGFTVPDHWHTSAERIVLVSGEMTVTFRDRPPVKLRPGMYGYGPAKASHSAVCAPGDPCVLFIAFESAVDAHPAASPPRP